MKVKELFKKLLELDENKVIEVVTPDGVYDLLDVKLEDQNSVELVCGIADSKKLNTRERNVPS